MRAAVATAYGPPSVVTIHERATPSAGAEQVVVRVEAAGVNTADTRIRGADFPDGMGLLARLTTGITKPRKPVLGGSFAGVVESVGTDVHGVKVGDRICGGTGFAMGCHAEFVATKACYVVPVPDAVSYEDAVSVVFGGTTALHFLRACGAVDAPEVAGKQVLVVGAAGSVGTACVQLAAQAGAHVTGVCSGKNAEFVTGLGAADVVDYTAGPVPVPGQRYDVIVEVVGTRTGREWEPHLVPGGKVALIVAGLRETIAPPKFAVAGVAKERTEDVARLIEGVAAKTFDACVSETFPLDAIQEAHAVVDSGHKRGNVAVLPQR